MGAIVLHDREGVVLVGGIEACLHVKNRARRERARHDHADVAK
jgi:hypothetical protein